MSVRPRGDAVRAIARAVAAQLKRGGPEATSGQPSPLSVDTGIHVWEVSDSTGTIPTCPTRVDAQCRCTGVSHTQVLCWYRSHSIPLVYLDSFQSGVITLA